MRLFLLSFFVLSLGLVGQGQVVYEDFEAGASLNWTAVDGTFDGVVANPDSNFVNGSDSCGAYTKSDQASFSLFRAETATPLDLSTNNQFSIQVYAPVRTSFILKLEGPQGSVELTKNIANANVWQEYTFDFSSAANIDSLHTILLFFDPGVTNSNDTYLFDNLIANPAGPCAGTVPDPDLFDDFECQRNASYSGGWNIIRAIPNPDATGINTSSTVGEYVDPLDQFSALVVNYNDPIDLSVKNTFIAKIWAPKAGNLLFKLEGGVSPPAEISIPVTQLNTWVEYKASFPDQANANHQSIAIFFNAGVTADSGDIYYIDDIGREETPTSLTLEDFEPTPKLSWEPLNANTALHGTFNGVVTNPDQAGANTSTNVGQYTKGSAAFSTLTSPLPLDFSLEQFSQVNLQVKPPANATQVTIQLLSAIQGNKEATAMLDGTTDWQDLAYDFSGSSNITDFERINILFDDGTANQGQAWLFDNLTLSQTTIDPCLGIDPLPNKLDDFECQRNVTYGAGGDILKVINNPDISNENTSEKVGEYTDPFDQFSALVLDFGGPIDLSVFNQFNIKIWAPAAVPLVFKLEGGSSTPVEVPVDVTTAMSWQSYTVDFSPYANENHTSIAIFFNFAVVPTTQDIYYVDDMEWTRTPFTACIANFESFESSLTDWQTFANGSLESSQVEIIDNPDPTGINQSTKVAAWKEATDGETFAGAFTRTTPAPISLPNDNKTIRVKFWADQEATMVLKLEAGRDGAANSGDIMADYTTPNTWQELTFDYSAIVPDDALYDRLTIIPGFGEVPMEEKTYYFDDFVIADASCTGATSLEPGLEQVFFQLFPNPATDHLTITTDRQLQSVEIYNAVGQQMLVRAGQNRTGLNVSIEVLPPGVYIVRVIDQDLRASQTKLIKR